MRCVCSCTTIPSRLIDPKFQRVLTRLNEQTRPFDQIYLGLPNKSKRFGIKYPKVPNQILKLCTVVNLDEDYGPISKILAGFIQEDDPNTLIVTCDDDIIYPKTLVEDLLRCHKQSPNSAICFTGLNLGKFPGYVSLVLNYDMFDRDWWFNLPVKEAGVPVDILMGYSGVLYKRKFFPRNFEGMKRDLLKYTSLDENVFIHDDVLLSSYLSSKGIERRAFKNSTHVQNTYMSGALSGNSINLKFITAFFRSCNMCKKWGLLGNLQETNMLNTVTGPLFIILLVVIFIVLLIMIS